MSEEEAIKALMNSKQVNYLLGQCLKIEPALNPILTKKKIVEQILLGAWKEAQ